jgi:hypothetical protein
MRELCSDRQKSALRRLRSIFAVLLVASGVAVVLFIFLLVVASLDPVSLLNLDFYLLRGPAPSFAAYILVVLCATIGLSGAGYYYTSYLQRSVCGEL